MAYLTPLLFEKSRQALGTTQAKLGESLGLSRRTAQRWASRGGLLLEGRMLDLIRRVYPRDPELAAVLASTLGSTLEGLGIVSPPPPPLPPPEAAPPPPPPLPTGVVDAVVCAAAEAMELTPRAVRRGLHAAFARAQEIGLTLDAVVQVLAASLPPVEPPKDGVPR
jgi:hypothetical protein